MQQKVTDLWNIASLKVTYQMKVFRQFMYSKYATRSEEHSLAVLQELAHCFIFCLWSQLPCFLYGWFALVWFQFYASENLFKSMVLEGCKSKVTKCWIRLHESNCVGLREQNPERNRCKTPPKMTSEAFTGTLKCLCFKILHLPPSQNMRHILW